MVQKYETEPLLSKLLALSENGFLDSKYLNGRFFDTFFNYELFAGCVKPENLRQIVSSIQLI